METIEKMTAMIRLSPDEPISLAEARFFSKLRSLGSELQIKFECLDFFPSQRIVTISAPESLLSKIFVGSDGVEKVMRLPSSKRKVL